MDVVLITAAAARHDHVFDEDGQVDQSLPAIRALATDGTVFTRAYAGAPSSDTSRRAILSGTHAPTTETDSSRPNALELFAHDGYEVAAFHGDPDASLDGSGFEVPERPNESEGFSDRVRRALGRRIATESALSGHLEAADRTLGSSLGVRMATSSFVSGERVTERALSWLEDSSGPRFLWVHYDDARPPHKPRDGTVSEGCDPRRARKLAHACAEDPTQLSDDEHDELRRLYRGELEHLDDCISDLLRGVSEHLGGDDTVVGFAGTGGCALGERGTWYARDDALRDEVVRVPLVVRGPGFTSQEAGFAVSSVDVLPTLLGAAGIRTPSRCVGSDLGALAGERVTERQVFARANDPPAAMVCNGRWKLSRSLADGRERLFDRSEDPAERRDRSGENLPVHRALKHALDCFVESRHLRERSPPRSRLS
jgi:arylsulfatase A-like enzyme